MRSLIRQAHELYERGLAQVASGELDGLDALMERRLQLLHELQAAIALPGADPAAHTPAFERLLQAETRFIEAAEQALRDISDELHSVQRRRQKADRYLTAEDPR